MEVQAFCWVNQITITPKKIHLGWLCLAECNILLSDCLPNVTIMLPCSPIPVPLGHQAMHPDTFGSPMHTAHQWTLLIIPFFALLLWGLPMQLIALLEDRDLTKQCSVLCIDCVCTDHVCMYVCNHLFKVVFCLNTSKCNLSIFTSVRLQSKI